jgi:hypothetical protein
VLPSGIHGSLQIFNDSPFPTHQIIHFLRRSKPLRMLHHVYEIPSFGMHCRKSPSGAYLVWITEQPPPLSCKHRHIKQCKSQKPNPPPSFFFGKVNFSHATQYILFSLSFWLHYHRPIIKFNSSHKSFIRSKQDITYVGIALLVGWNRGESKQQPPRFTFF